MKKLLVFAWAVCFVSALYSQTLQPGGRFQLMRERISKARLNEIAKRMDLDQEKLEKLKPVFMEWEKQKAASRLTIARNTFTSEADSLSDKEAERIYFAQLNQAKKMIELREKFYHEFRKVLSPSEIMKFHRIEADVSRRMLQNLRQRGIRNIHD
jgi:hypothetical protein